MAHEVQLAQMAEGAPVMLWMAGADSHCTFFNETWLAFCGRSLEQEVGVGWVEGVHPDDRDMRMHAYRRAFESRAPFEHEYRLRRHDGTYRWVLDRGTARYAPSGEFVGYIGSCFDITDRREVEAVVESLADDLLRANQELARLLHAASHDLREPLRTVISFADLLERRSRDKLGDVETEYLHRIRRGAVRMRELVTSLSDLAQLRDAPLSRERLDMRALVESVVADLDLRVKEAGARIEIAPLPEMTGDPLGLRRVLQNLISNALKFRRGDSVHITIGGERRGDEALCWVEDDGIGFDPVHAGDLFEMFWRLHPKDRFEGSGVGLALVRDVIARHGGRVWAESSPGTGSRFTIALPAHS